MRISSSIYVLEMTLHDRLASPFYFILMGATNFLFKRKHRMHRSLMQEGTRKGTLAGTGGQKGGMFGESTGPGR
jgi:hypothetical protein